MPVISWRSPLPYERPLFPSATMAKIPKFPRGVSCDTIAERRILTEVRRARSAMGANVSPLWPLERSKNKEWKVELDYLEISAALGLYVGCCESLPLKLSLRLFVVPDYVGARNQIIPQKADVWNFKRSPCLQSFCLICNLLRRLHTATPSRPSRDSFLINQKWLFDPGVQRVQAVTCCCAGRRALLKHPPGVTRADPALRLDRKSRRWRSTQAERRPSGGGSETA